MKRSKQPIGDNNDRLFGRLINVTCILCDRHSLKTRQQQKYWKNLFIAFSSFNSFVHAHRIAVTAAVAAAYLVCCGAVLCSFHCFMKNKLLRYFRQNSHIIFILLPCIHQITTVTVPTSTHHTPRRPFTTKISFHFLKVHKKKNKLFCYFSWTKTLYRRTDDWRQTTFA